MPENSPLLNWLMDKPEGDSQKSSPDIRTLRFILEKTLSDDRLSKSEKEVLRDCIWDQARRPDEARLTFLRRAAFDLVTERLESAQQRELLEWLHDIVELLIPRQFTSKNKTSQSVPTQVLFSPNDPCADRISGLIDRSHIGMDLCVFTITDNRLSESILSAFGRGLKIRLITDDMKSEDLGSDIQRIAAAGIPVKFDRSPFHMHHKFAIFDGTTVLTGSYNWTRNASQENLENLLVTQDRQIVQPFSEEFERLWASLSAI